MRKMLWVSLLVLWLMFSWTLVYAGDFYVIRVAKCCTCKGTLFGARWCDNGDGTVTDLTTCLVWLKDASWGGGYAFWVDTMVGTNAHDRAAQLKNGVGGLTDGSEEGSWRLPTLTELHGLANGPEAVRSSTPRAFTGVESSFYMSFYWSSATVGEGLEDFAWLVCLEDGFLGIGFKAKFFSVWAVRGQQ